MQEYLSTNDGYHLVACKTREEAQEQIQKLKVHKRKLRVVFGFENIGQVLHEISNPIAFSASAASCLLYELPECSTAVSLHYQSRIIEWNTVELLCDTQPVCQKCFLDGNITFINDCLMHETRKRKLNNTFLSPLQHQVGLPQIKNKCQCGKSRPTFALKGQKAIWCSKCKQKDAVDVYGFKCACGKTPSFALKGQKKAIWCATCKDINAISTSCKPCVCGKAIPTFALPGNKAIWCKLCKEHNAVNVKDKKCECGLAIASFAKEGTKTAVYCAKCRTETAVPVKHAMCCCGKSSPYFGWEGKHAEFCLKCKPVGTVDVVHKRCECGLTVASWGMKDEPLRWCRDCPGKDSSAVNITGKRQKCSCGKAIPTFGLSGQKAIYCKVCKTPDSINVKDRKCKCEKARVPVFGIPGQKPEWCSSCRTTDSVNVRKPLCACGKYATFGLVGQSPTTCSKCKTIGMMSSPTKQCVVSGCKELALYGITTAKRERCEEHKQETDRNMIEKNCVSCGLLNVLDATQKCKFCNPESFAAYKIRKEHEVVAFLRAQGIELTNDKIANGPECGKERPDIVIRLLTHVIIIEVDENQHKNSNCLCEQVRMINITQTFGGLPCFWIRYNPDKFKMTTFEEDITKTRRLAKLLEWVKFAEKRTMTTLGEVMYLFFDNCSQPSFASDIVVLPSS